MIRIQREDFDPGREADTLVRGRTDVGALVTFTGLVRGEPGSAIELEHYAAMAQTELDAIEAEARARWPLQDCLVIHRYGRLLPGERIVLVVTASAHREAAFAAAEFLMDYLKTRAPFWKRETTKDGTVWVEAKAKDDDALERWKK
jgi:molybdopterin synthase catalytic subunit